jgi:hypothetical protein
MSTIKINNKMKTNILPIAILTFIVINVYSQTDTTGNKLLFHDYQPDVLLLNPYYDSLYIDFNRDKINDVVFYLVPASGGGPYAYIKPTNPNCAFSLLNYYHSDSLKNDSIRWHTEKLWMLGEPTYNRIEKVGIRIQDGGKNYYGWVKVFFVTSQFNRIEHIDQYAFCTIPDYPLVWGQNVLTGDGKKRELPNQGIIINKKDGSIEVQSEKTVKEVRLLNSSGALLKWKHQNKSKNVHIETQGLPHGTYLIQVSFADQKFYSEKIAL